MAIDLSKAKKEDPSFAGSPKVKDLPPIQKAGYKLAIFVLIIIGVYILFIICLLLFNDLDISDVYNANSLPENFDKLSEEKRAYRKFIIEVSQLVLLNLLLPTLTAILGYIFGSNESK
jgi:hypothetical protein